jgi:hypothetical protein
MYNHFIKTSQGVGGIASVPGQVPGLNNILLSDNVNDTSMQAGMQAGVNPEDAIETLNLISRAKNSKEMQNFKPIVENLKRQLQIPEFAKWFDRLEKAMDVNADPLRQTRNPSDGEVEPLAQDIAKDIAERIRQYMKTSKELTPDNEQGIKQVEAQKKQKDEDDRTKKKTRGNPFRVLMGQVGKLLDHGMKKRDITKYLLRKKYWNEETIGKAINIVKDYNRKKRGKDKKETKAFNLNNYRTSQFIDNEQTELMNIIPFRNSKNNEEWTPDYDKRSTAELFARASWLKSVKSFTGDKHSEGRKVANLGNTAQQLRTIRAALKRRGFSEEELP